MALKIEILSIETYVFFSNRDNSRALAGGGGGGGVIDRTGAQTMLCLTCTMISGGGVIDRTGAQTMLCLTCTMISSVDLAHYGVSRAKDYVSVDCSINHLLKLENKLSDK